MNKKAGPDLDALCQPGKPMLDQARLIVCLAGIRERFSGMSRVAGLLLTGCAIPHAVYIHCECKKSGSQEARFAAEARFYTPEEKVTPASLPESCFVLKKRVLSFGP